MTEILGNIGKKKIAGKKKGGKKAKYIGSALSLLHPQMCLVAKYSSYNACIMVLSLR